MSYQGPIAMYTERIIKDIVEKQDGYLVEEVRKVGFDINKEELAKALKYDRDQYEKGFSDGLAYASRWISVNERLPEDLKFVLAVEDGAVFMAHCEHYYGEEEVYVEWHDTMYYPVSPTHWMPLPTPPKEETE